MQVFTRRDDRGLYHIEFGHAGMHLVLHDVEDLRRLIGGLVALAESDDSSF